MISQRWFERFDKLADEQVQHLETQIKYQPVKLELRVQPKRDLVLQKPERHER